MATTVHLPPELIAAVDRRAADLGVSRNRFILRALEKAIDEDQRWSPAFLTALAEAHDDVEGRELVDEMQAAMAARRTRKRAPRL